MAEYDELAKIFNPNPEDELERIKEGVRDFCKWADQAVNCDDLQILIGDMDEDEEIDS